MKKIKKRGEIFYYKSFDEDVQNLSFTSRVEIKDDFVYENKNIFYKLFSFILYWFIAKPILALVCKIRGISIKNKKYIKELRNTGYFIYGNHISNYDAISINTLAIWSKKVYLVAFSDALTIPFVKYIAKGLGMIPLGNSIKNQINMMKYMEKIIKKKQCILIYPEGHEWPYYTSIRPFKEGAFHYPSKFNCPILPFVQIVKERKIFKNLKPKLEIRFLEPIYPKKDLTIKENKEYLMNNCFNEMHEEIKKHKQFEYYKYVKIDENSE